MIVKFLEDLIREKNFYEKNSALSTNKFYRIQGHCFSGEKDAVIVVDNILLYVGRYVSQDEQRFFKWGIDEITKIIIHELIHKVGRWYPEETDGLVYESPVDDLVQLIMEMLEDD